MWLISLADDSHEMSSLIFSKKKKKKKKIKMLSAAIVIRAFNKGDFFLSEDIQALFCRKGK